MTVFDEYVATERNKFILEQKRIHTKNQKIFTDYMNAELSHICDLFTNTTNLSIKEINTASTTQQDIINDLSTNMIAHCTQLGDNLVSTVATKTLMIIKKVTAYTHVKELKAMQECKIKWTTLKESHLA